MTAAKVEPFTDGLGVERYRLTVICESPAHASAMQHQIAACPPGCAYEPLPKPPGVNPHPLEASEVADDPPERPAALRETEAYLREHLPDDDEGLAPGEPPRCRANGSCD